MSRKVSRRSFVKQSAVLGASSILGADLLTGGNQAQRQWKGDDIRIPPRYQGSSAISVATGQDYIDNTIGTVEQIGGMGQFVPEGAKVTILANPQRPNPGAFTRPDIVRGVVRMCNDVGADQVACIGIVNLS
jgi:hypothetical protein